MIMCKKLHLDSSITININLKHSSNVARKDFFLSQCLSPTRSKKQVLANCQGKLIKCWGNLGWTSIPSRGGVGGGYLLLLHATKSGLCAAWMGHFFYLSTFFYHRPLGQTLVLLLITELAERSPRIIQNSSNPSSRKNLDVQPYDRPTNCTTGTIL